MAEGTECFNIGSIVKCMTCFNEEIAGEVLAFDPQVKILILKCSPASGQTSFCDINMVNLGYVSHVHVEKEGGTQLPSLPPLNWSKLDARKKRGISRKQHLFNAIRSGVSEDGQCLFSTINKTIDDIEWSGTDILVMDQVIISPPYQIENVTEMKDVNDSTKKALTHVKKIVEKHYKDLQAAKLNNVKASNHEVQPVSQ